MIVNDLLLFFTFKYEKKTVSVTIKIIETVITNNLNCVKYFFRCEIIIIYIL